MTLRYLPDTNVLSEPLRLHPDDGVLQRLQRHERALCTCAPVWNELWFGAARLADGPKRCALRDSLVDVVRPSLPVLPYDGVAAAWHAEERARLRSIGRTPPFVDGRIAPIARTRGLVLVTRNTADVAHFDGLAHKDWFAAATPKPP